MKKRIFSAFLAFAMLLSLLPAGVFAAGAGDAPTEISSAEELRQLESAAEGSRFILAADIALPSEWTPLQVLYDNLVLDGNGYTITLDGAPLFGNMGNCTVTNLLLEGQVTSDNADTASLAAISRGVIRNCISYADVTYTGNAGGSAVPRFVAGLVAQFSATGTVDNCVYAGVVSHGNAEAYGSLANTAFFVDADIKNSIGVGSERIGSAEGLSAPTEIAVGTNTMAGDASGFVPADYVTQLNTNRDAGAGDLEWEVRNDRLSLIRTAEEAPPASEAEIAGLQAAVQQTVDSGKIYTADSWSAYSDALARAQGILAQDAPKRNAVTAATAALNTAYSALAERALSAVSLSEQDVTSITTVSGLESIQSGKFYRLDADLEITASDWYFPGAMNAVLDGNGHTITISAPNVTLWSTLGPDAVVQNLGIRGSVSSYSSAGAVAQSCQGLIVNCWSLADVTTTSQNNIRKHTGGLVGELKSGGAVVNCYAAGKVTANGSSGGSAGVLAGSTEANSLLQACYGLTDTFRDVGGGMVRDCAVKTRKDFYSPEFLGLLNQNRGAYGKEWTLSSAGYPHLGPAESYTPPEAALITFTYSDQRTVAFKSDEGLTVSLQDASGYVAGRFSMAGAARWQDTIAGNKDVLLVNEDGTLNIYKPGSADVVAISSEADGSRELARFPVTVVQGEAVDGFRLTLDGQDAGVSLTLQGSEQVTLVPEILRGGVWSAISPSQVQFSHTGALHRVNGTIYAEEPGEMTLSASYMGKTVTVAVTSEFVPIASVRPSPAGTYVVHQRNTNAQPLGAFLNLTLSDGAGTVTVLPENASYRDKWTMRSSDDSIAEYVASMLVAVLPKKAGTVTLTAVVEADGLQPRVEGTSQITIQYRNPVETVSIAQTEFTLKEQEELPLPLTLRGPKSSEGLRVTEPGMNWSFRGEGQVEIVTDGLPVVTQQRWDGTLLCEANDSYKLVGVSAGTVTVTGTPQDQTGGAPPVTFTVTVEEGAPLVPADNAALAAAGIANGRGYLTGTAGDYAYGSEWEIFSLRRAGQTIDPAKLDAYLDSLEDTYRHDPDATAMKPTTIARAALALGALGQNTADFRGLNLLEMLYSSDRIREGGNEPMWALLALDSRGCTVPAGARWTRDQLITELIVRYQTPEGGFGLNDNRTASVDMTAMAIQALAPYRAGRRDVREAVDKALVYLRGQMSADCGFGGNAESTAQVVIALTALGLDPVDRENGFVRSEAVNLLTNLTSFAHPGGGYRHYASDQGAQPMSTTQVLMAFEVYRRFAAGEAGLYDLTDAADVRSALAQRLAEAAALREADYTAATWAALRKAVTEARRALDGGAADEALAAALAGLERVSGGSQTPGTPQDTITVSFRLVGDTRHEGPAAHNQYVNWIRTMSVTVPAGSTVYDVLVQALRRSGLRFEENQTGYISGIQAPAALGGGWLREFDNGPSSGWKYLVNGSYPGVGLQYYWPKAGDAIVWRYVDDYNDPADNTAKWEEAADTDPAAGTGSAADAGTVLQPDAPVKNGTASATVTGSQMKAAVARTKAEGGTAIVIAPQVRGEAQLVQVDLPASAVRDMTQETSASLAVRTGLAQVTLPHRSLEDLSAAGAGTIRISVGAVENGAVRIAAAVGGQEAGRLAGGLKLSIPAAAGPGSTLVIVGADGTETVVRKSAADGSAMRALLDGTATVRIVNNARSFADTDAHWAKDAVAFAAGRELLLGTGKDRFSPDVPMSRAMLAAVLRRLEDAGAGGAAAFPDIPEDAWYRGAAAWAGEAGIISGTGSGFDPNGCVTREQLAVMLCRYAGTLGLDTAAAGRLADFRDQAQIAPWAVDAVEWAVGAGLLQGSENALDPKGAATRAQVAAVLQRLIAWMVK